MDKPISIRVPYEVVNDDMVVIAQWRVQEGDMVHAGDVVTLLETSKSILEIEAEADGYIHILHSAGEEVAVGEEIGQVWSALSMPVSSADSASSNVASENVDTGEAAEVMLSARARSAMETHGISPKLFAGRGLVRERDVLEVVRERENIGLKSEGDGAAGEDDPRPEQFPNEKPATSVGLWRDARTAAKERGRSLVWLALHYVCNTWFLSNIVRWTPRFAILTVHRWRGVGIGSGCFIDPNAILETAHPENITIGDDVRIAAGAVIMTHIKPPLYLREKELMSSTLNPVVLEDHCFIGVNAVVMPGVRIGKAAVVVSGAVVVGDVADHTVVAGSPAKVVKRFKVEE